MKQLSEECIKAIKEYYHIGHGVGYNNEANGAIKALTNPEIYTKADLVSKEDALVFAKFYCTEQFSDAFDLKNPEELYNLYINQKK